MASACWLGRHKAPELFCSSQYRGEVRKDPRCWLWQKQCCLAGPVKDHIQKILWWCRGIRIYLQWIWQARTHSVKALNLLLKPMLLYQLVDQQAFATSHTSGNKHDSAKVLDSFGDSKSILSKGVITSHPPIRDLAPYSCRSRVGRLQCSGRHESGLMTAWGAETCLRSWAILKGKERSLACSARGNHGWDASWHERTGDSRCKRVKNCFEQLS